MKGDALGDHFNSFFLFTGVDEKEAVFSKPVWYFFIRMPELRHLLSNLFIHFDLWIYYQDVMYMMLKGILFKKKTKQQKIIPLRLLHLKVSL